MDKLITQAAEYLIWLMWSGSISGTLNIWRRRWRHTIYSISGASWVNECGEGYISFRRRDTSKINEVTIYVTIAMSECCRLAELLPTVGGCTAMCNQWLYPPPPPVGLNVWDWWIWGLLNLTACKTSRQAQKERKRERTHSTPLLFLSVASSLCLCSIPTFSLVASPISLFTKLSVTFSPVSDSHSQAASLKA